MKKFSPRSYLPLIILLVFLGYGVRLLQVESNREYSQGGFAHVLGDVVGKKVQPNLWANGIGCAYWLRLKNCIGVEIVDSRQPADFTNKINMVANNFCGLVEANYPKEKYIFHSGALAKEFDSGLGRAYLTFFDCKNSRKPIGEIRVYINPSGAPIRKAEWILNPKLTMIFPNLEGGEK